MLKYFSQKKSAVMIVCSLLVIAGIWVFNKIPADIFPNLNYPLLNVITHYPGGSPRDIEVLITKPIENQMSGLTRVRRVSSISRDGLSQVSIEFDWGVDVENARQRVSQSLLAVSASLPQGAISTVENLGSNLQQFMGFGVISVSGTSNISDLKYLTQTRIVNQLKSVHGVARIEIVGGETQAIEIAPSAESLWKYNISLSEIKSIIRSNNFQTMSGYLEQSYQDYAIRCLGTIRNMGDLEDVVLKKVNGVPLLLKDVASVKMGQLPQRYSVYINGQPGVSLSIFKTIHTSTINVARDVQKKISDISRSLPSGMKIIKYYDQSEIISESAGSLKQNIILGGFLVVLVLFLFLGNIRHAVIIALTIPAIMIISFLFFGMEHITLNMITLGAMAVAVGMIVDDSIIILENIQRHKHEGKEIFLSIKDGVREIAAADMSGTLTTVAAFIPFVFLPGLAGRFTAPFGMVMITTLVISLIVSLTLIPLLLLGKDKNTIKQSAVFDGILKAFISFNHKVLNTFFRRKKAVVISIILLFILSGGLLIFSRITLLPEIDEGAILLEYILPPGTSLNESTRIGKILAGIARKDSEVETVYQRTGSEGGTYQIEPVNRGEIIIKLVSRKIRKHHIFEIMDELKKQMSVIPGTITLFHQVTSEKLDESMSGLPAIFGVTLYGEGYETLMNYSRDIEKIAISTKGVENVINNIKYKVPEIQIIPNRDKLAQYGISSKKIMEEIRLYLGGEVVSQIIKNQKSISLFLKLRTKEMTIESIKELPIKINTHEYIPISRLANISISYGANAITHINFQRAITLPMEVDGSVRSIVKAMKEKIKKLQLPNGYFVTFGGQYQLFVQLAMEFLFFALLSILIVYLIMYFQFGNYVHPLAIMLEIPFSLIGAFIAIVITRQPLNISFLIGLITLIGVSVNNGIVFIDYVNKKRHQGTERSKAIFQAVQVRTRPIILTALTSVLALLPISLGFGIGSKMHQPLAICIMGGLLFNIFLTLNVLPIIYCMLEDLFKKEVRYDKRSNLRYAGR